MQVLLAMEEAAQRRERLKALRAAAELSQQPDEPPGGEGGHVNGPAAAADGAPVEEDGEGPGVRFRNYLPRTQELQQQQLPPVAQAKFEDPVAAPAPTMASPEDAIAAIAPKKPNWDLRRDVAKKLEKLERRTQRAMIELMQEEEKRRQEEAAAEEGMDAI